MKRLSVLTISFLIFFSEFGLFSVQAEQFPIGGMPPRFHRTGYDYPVYSSQIHDVKELGINILWTTNKNMLNWAADSGLKVVYYGNKWNLYPDNWNYGQYAKYNSDLQIPLFYTFCPFSHTTVVGEEIYDHSVEDYVWRVNSSEHSAGYAQRDLIVNYQQDNWWWDITYSIDYTAKFRLKVDYNEDPIPVATLYAVRKEGANEEVLAQQTIFADDFNNPNSYQYFELNFTLDTSSVPSSHLSKKITVSSAAKKSSDLPTTDFRIYWYGYVNLWIDHVEIYDYKSKPLLAGYYDSNIQSDINSLSSYSAPYRLSIRDEPCEDNYPIAAYIRSFIENSGHKGLTDALPEYAENEWTHEAPDYGTYLDEYHHYLQPDEYLFNHLTYQYQWWRTPHLDGLFENLKIIREKSLQNNKDFYSTILTFGWNDSEIQTKIDSGYIDSAPYSVIYDEMERRMNASVFENLAYGAKGFHYWNIYPGLYRYSYGVRTAAWYYAKEINDKVHALADHFLNINSIAAFATWFDNVPLNSFVKSVSEDSIVVGVFEHKSTGQIYFMLVNPRWYAGGEKTFTIQFDCQGYSTDVCVEDILSSTPPWNNDPNHPSTRILMLNQSNQYIMTESIDAGEGRLYRIININPSIPQNFSGTWYNNHPKIYWTANTEPDFDHYEVWKKKGSASWSLKTTTTNTSYVDLSEWAYSGFPDVKLKVYYKVCAVDNAEQKSSYTPEKSFTVNAPQQSKGTIGGITVALDPIPLDYQLHPAFPNPFNTITTLKLDLPEKTTFSLIIYDIKGSEVWSLNNRYTNSYSAGYHTIIWNGTDNNGSILPTGLYLIVFISSDYKMNQKLVLVK